MTDQQRIAEITARCEAATPGPWESANKSVRVTGSQQEAPWGKYAPCGYEGGICNCLGKSSYQSSAKDQVNVQAKANSAFIAHARGDLPWAVDTIKALEAQLAASQARERAAVENYNVLVGLIAERLSAGSFEKLCELADELEVFVTDWRGPQEAGEGKQDG